MYHFYNIYALYICIILYFFWCLIIMLKRRFFFNYVFRINKEIYLFGDIRHKIVNVLRMKVGQHIVLFNKFGIEKQNQLFV